MKHNKAYYLGLIAAAKDNIRANGTKISRTAQFNTSLTLAMDNKSNSTENYLLCKESKKKSRSTTPSILVSAKGTIISHLNSSNKKRTTIYSPGRDLYPL